MGLWVRVLPKDDYADLLEWSEVKRTKDKITVRRHETVRGSRLRPSERAVELADESFQVAMVKRMGLDCGRPVGR